MRRYRWWLQLWRNWNYKFGLGPSREPDVAGYKVYYGTSSRTYGLGIDVGNAKTFALTGLIKGRRYFIAVKAYNASRHETDFSKEASGIAE